MSMNSATANWPFAACTLLLRCAGVSHFSLLPSLIVVNVASHVDNVPSEECHAKVFLINR